MKSSSSYVSLVVRTEIFEHGVFPPPAKLNAQNLLAVFKTLHLMSTIDYRISLDQWKEQSSKFLAFTPEEAESYFNVYKVLCEDFENFLTTANNQATLNKTVDVRSYALFMGLQLHNVVSRHSSDTKYLDAIFNSNSASTTTDSKMSPTTSPRSKILKSTQSSSEYQLIVHFVKSNLKLFLRLISSDIHNAEIALNVSEFNILRMILKVENAPSTQQSLSLYANFFKNVSPSYKVPLMMISDWIIQNLAMSESPETIFLSGYNKGVTIKSGEAIMNKDVKITRCEESNIYIDANVRNISIMNSNSITVFVAAASRMVTIDGCENATIVVAANMIRIGNSVDSTFHLYSTNNPILYGDNRALVLAPHNAYYQSLTTHLKKAQIATMVRNVHLWSHPIIMNGDTQSCSFLKPKDYFKMILPEEFQDTTPILAPSEFVEAIKIRNQFLEDIQREIRDEDLTEDQSKKLHTAIQGYFREWLVSTGQNKSISDLVKMIDQE